jgi:hypothetical protein
MEQTVDWAGVAMLPLGHHDGRFIRSPGLYAFVRREPDWSRTLLWVGHADDIAAAAGPGHPQWTPALLMGMNELHVALEAKLLIDRLILRGELIKRLSPPLNLAEDELDEPAPRRQAG